MSCEDAKAAELHADWRHSNRRVAGENSSNEWSDGLSEGAEQTVERLISNKVQ